VSALPHTKTLPLFDLSRSWPSLRDEALEVFERVAEAGAFSLGSELLAFEDEFAAYCGAAHGIGVANGTVAIELALAALGAGPGREVVTVPHTFVATVEAIHATGATPVLVDIDPVTRCMDPAALEAALTERTAAVVPVHLYGRPAPMDEILRICTAAGVPVVEDTAQAHGALLDGRRAGGIGAAGAFSFYPTKNLGAMGDGGAVVTDDPEIAERVRTLRFHGSRDKVTYDEVGVNSRLDELQAAVLRVQLPHLDGWCEARRAAAATYAELGLGELVALPVPAPGSTPAWHLFVIRHPEAARLEEGLRERGVEARGYYRTPVHLQPAMRPWSGAVLPGTDEAARTHLAIPLHAALSREHAEAVTQAIGDVLS
jgi:dTDP-3-amino-3,4,6-trideoxy-alpha-D-glucose transaminase